MCVCVCVCIPPRKRSPGNAAPRARLKRRWDPLRTIVSIVLSVCLSLYKYLSAYRSIHVYINIYICICVCICICISIYLYTYIYISISLYINIYIYMYICICLCVCIYIYAASIQLLLPPSLLHTPPLLLLFEYLCVLNFLKVKAATSAAAAAGTDNEVYLKI